LPKIALTGGAAGRLARPKIGKRIADSNEMMVILSNSSMSVKAERFVLLRMRNGHAQL
jgi:hypothetical protein